ncbi:MAG: recombination regulator RecX [Rubrobacter sp.]|nr:recombination regulator RecX [Rubrobacter sp.]
MPEITRIIEKRGLARVQVDGEPFAEIDLDTMLSRGLYEGLSLTQEELDEVRLEGERSLALSRAFRYLGYRARSIWEVRERLIRYGYGEQTIEEVLLRLQELGYLDDLQFARQVASERSGKYGPRRVMEDLRRSGVDERAAREAVEEEFSGVSEYETAHAAVRRRYNDHEGSDALARRVHGFLARRGYSPEICSEIAREYRGDRGGL